jgi:DNA-binding NarL/FixJ family response regulator
VLIADDHPVVRQGLRVLLEVQDDMDVVGEAPDGPDVARLAAELAPDVILLDLKMPGMKGTDVIADLVARRIPARILVLTSVTDPAAAQAAVQAGASGFLYKDVDPDALVRAIRSVHDGNLLLSAEAAGTVLHRGADRGAVAGLDALTGREREVLEQITKGRSNREIARALNVAEKTVKTHVSSVLAKLGVADRTQAALHAVARDGDRGWGVAPGTVGRGTGSPQRE